MDASLSPAGTDGRVPVKAGVTIRRTTRIGDVSRLNDTVSGFLRILFIPLLVIAGFRYRLLTLILLPFPLNCVASSLPFCVTMWFALMEVRRQQRLGFAYHMVREIPQEQMERALREIEKEMKKSKPLP